MERKVCLDGVRVSFPQGNQTIEVLAGVSIQVGNGEFVSLLGPSGCGKSTILNVISGLVLPEAGTVNFAPGQEKKVSYMPQQDLLLPWRRVIDNVIIPLEIQGLPQAQARTIAAAWMDLFGLSGFEEAYPAQLSGGMRQRAALLRTFLHQGEIMLLDEPFGKLDALTRSNLQRWLLQVWEELRRTVVFVTHDIDEALYLSDRIYVMSERPGVIKGEIKVDLPRPRPPEIIVSGEFIRQKNDIWKLLK